MVCLFCLRVTIDGIPISGDTEQAKNVRDIICKYFWFNKNIIGSMENYACSDCWIKVEAFNEFYLMIETIHQTNSNEIDKKIEFVSPKTYDYELTIENELFIKNENDTLEEFNAIYIPNPVILDEPNSQHDEGNSNTKKQSKQSKSVNTKQSTARTSVQRRGSSYQKSETVSQKLTLKQQQHEGEQKAQKTVRTIDEIRCYICNKLYKSFRGLQYHIGMHDPIESQVKCDLCEKKFSNIRALKKHKYHHSVRSILCGCPICGKQIQESSLKLHILVKHENKKIEKPKVHMCDVCGKRFSSPSSLAQHAVIHIARQFTEVKCDICGKWQKNFDTLRNHKQTHIQTPQKCPHCDKVKINRRSLLSHIAISHSTPKYRCTFCEKAFTRLKSLKEHIATHTGESLYNCLYCTKQFKNDANKYKHMREQHLEQWNLDRVKKIN